MNLYLMYLTHVQHPLKERLLEKIDTIYKTFLTISIFN